QIAVGSGQLVICSSRPEENSWQSVRYENGVFTKRLLDGLRTRGDRTTLDEAFTLAVRTVTDEVKEDRPGARQTPVMSGKWNGKELIMAAKPAEPQAVPSSVLETLEPDSANAGSPHTTASPISKVATSTDISRLGEDPDQPRKLIHINLAYFPIQGD